MTNVKFSRVEFEKHIKLKPEVIEKISLFGTPLESINDKEIEIEIFPNRPDLISMQGYIRSFKAFLGLEKGIKKYKVRKSNLKLTVDKSVPKEWPYAYACIIKNIKLNVENIKEIIQVQEKLIYTLLRNRKKGGIGIYPLDKINFPIMLKGVELDKINFRPLGAAVEMKGSQILAKHPTGKKYSSICQSWSKIPVFVDNTNKIMSMLPIINSHDLGKVDENSKDLFIEVTGTDKKTLKKTLNIIATCLADIGGKIFSIECIQENKEIEDSPNLNAEINKISLDKINKILGLDLKEKNIEELISKMGHEYKKGKIISPAWRTDILHEIDLIEDIAIAYGYENIEPKIPSISTIGEESIKSKVIKKISDILIGLNLTEISSYHLIKQEDLRKIKEKELIELMDSKTDYNFLRPNLLIPALKMLSENKDVEYPQRIFEIGTVFKRDKKNKFETGIRERINLLIAISPGNFTEIKQILDNLLKNLEINFTIKESVHKELVEGRTADIILNKKIGKLGEVHPKTLKLWNINMPISILEISLDRIINDFKNN